MRAVRWVLGGSLAVAAAQPLAAQFRQPQGSPPDLVSWTPAVPTHAAPDVRIRPVLPTENRSLKHALIGGVIGAAAGALLCTVISNVADDAAADRFTTCTASGYLLFTGGGFVLGALIGAATD